MVATLVAGIAGRTVTFAVTGAQGPLSVRWGDSTDGMLPAGGGAHVYGDGEYRAIVIDGATGQRMAQSVIVPAPGVPTIDRLSSDALPVGPPSDTDLHIYGTGFGRCSQIRFGANLEQAWTLSREHFRSSTEVVLEISGGLFPAEDDAVSVSVLTDVPGGGESASVNFIFGDPPPPDPGP